MDNKKQKNSNRFLSANEKKEYSFIVKLYPFIALFGWLLSFILLFYYNTVYQFYLLAIFLLLINAYVMIKFELYLFGPYYGWALWAVLWLLGISLNKNLNIPKNKFNRILGLIFLLLGTMGVLIFLGMKAGMLS